MKKNQVLPFEFNPSSGLLVEMKKHGQRHARISKRTACEREQFRKDQTRRKIIAGAIVLKHAERDPNGLFSRTLWWLLDRDVNGAKERKLFDLNTLPGGQTNIKAALSGSLTEFFHACLPSKTNPLEVSGESSSKN